MTRLRRYTVVGSLALTLGGCGERDVGAATQPGLAAVISGDPILTLGLWDTQDEAQVLSQPVSAVVVRDSLVVVLESESGELRAFALDGSSVWRTGGRGGGPGEFDNPPWFAASANVDTLLVGLDATGTRANIYGSDGRIIEGVGLPTSLDRFPDVYGVLDGDPPVAVLGYETTPLGGGAGRSTMHVVAIPLRSPARPDTVGSFSGPLLIEVPLERGVAITAEPRSGELRAAANGALIITAGTDDSVHVRGGDGTQLRAFALPGGSPEAPWTGRDLDSVHLDGVGRIWLSRRLVAGERGRRWMVMDVASGRHTPELHLRGSIRGIGRHLIVLGRPGEMDEHLLLVYRLGDPILNLTEFGRVL